QIWAGPLQPVFIALSRPKLEVDKLMQLTELPENYIPNTLKPAVKQIGVMKIYPKLYGGEKL
ncbi:MAG: hypothetical protein ABEJ98_04655, partial [Candidatus Nanohaloarchaea archaeon]